MLIGRTTSIFTPSRCVISALDTGREPFAPHVILQFAIASNLRGSSIRACDANPSLSHQCGDRFV
ncbi:Uncharacterised protein [Vibrio cholerae]|nr:Uncharacterised protein [Vibrio cholerae]